MGINTAIIMMAQGIGFSIPSVTSRWVVSQLLTHGKVRRAFLGIAARHRPLDRRVVRFHGFMHHDAVEILSVDSESPAGTAGLLAGDFIVAIHSKRILTVDDLHRFLAEWPIGKEVNITILRGNRKREVTVVLVSQFTLYADCRKGNRPSFTGAAPPVIAEALYNLFAQQLRAAGMSVATGQFQSHMRVALVNDGPVTLVLEN